MLDYCTTNPGRFVVARQRERESFTDGAVLSSCHIASHIKSRVSLLSILSNFSSHPALYCNAEAWTVTQSNRSPRLTKVN